MPEGYTMSNQKWNNPRYVLYAKAHGKSPEEMMAHDEKAWPGGIMTGFTLWISQQAQILYKAHPEAFIDRWTISDNGAWDSWLEKAAKGAT
jgi:hypothetical protein